MQTFRMSWLFVIFFLTLTSNNTEARHHYKKKLPSVVVTGTVYCDTCFQQDSSTASHFISGASVAVECPEGNSKPGFRQEVKTNERGEFRAELPSSISKHLRKIKACTVKLISSSEPNCAVASSATSSMHLKLTKQGEHIFSAGFFSFKPLKQPTLCDQKPSIHNSKSLELDSVKTFQTPATDLTFPPPLQDPPSSNLPLPELPPLPSLPPLPNLPGLPNLGIPLPPIPGQTKQSVHSEPANPKPAEIKDYFLPPIAPLPPLLPLIPNPLQPPTTPLTPNPLQPPKIPALPIPTVPGSTPSPSTPSLPFPLPSIPLPSTPPLPVPIPSIPLPSTPLIPGGPPAKKNSP